VFSVAYESGLREFTGFDFGPILNLTPDPLVLRQMALTDAEDVFVLSGEPEVQRFKAEPSRDVEETQQSIRKTHAAQQECRTVMWAVAQRGPGQLVEGVSLHDWSRRHGRRR